jgi:hypothetical protein
MTDEARKLRFALDQNFPAPVLAAFAVMLPNVDLVPLIKIDDALTDVDDWELFVALHRHAEHWDGLVTEKSKTTADAIFQANKLPAKALRPDRP